MNEDLCRLVNRMLRGEVEPEVVEDAIYDRFGEAAERILPRPERPMPPGETVDVTDRRAES